MSRIWVIFSFFLLFFAAIIVRLFYWHIWESSKLRDAAAGQHLIRFSIPAKRGNIYSSDGYPLVLSKEVSLVYANPREIENMYEASGRLATLLNVDSASISALLSLPDRVWVPLKHKVEKETVDAIKETGIKGIGFEKESKRYYPEGSMSAHLLGFVGADENGFDKGYFGIEGWYNRELSGKDGFLAAEKDAHGTPILIGETLRVEPENGRTLTLYVDRTIQGIVEKKLSQGIEKYGAKEGAIVVMDPKTGGIISMASYPSYDPSIYTEFEKSLYKNPVVAGSYEPGSTFKSLIMAAGINEGVIKPDTIIDESGQVQIGEYSIKTWNDQYHGKISMTDVLKYSSNVGMVFVERALGEDKLLKAIKDYGFGKPTGVDLEDESSPSLRKDSEWYEIDYATASFGQGIASTPLQLVRAVSAIANGGQLLEPHVVKSITDDKGKVYKTTPKKIRTVLSEKAAKQVTEMMVAAVDYGEAKWAKPKGYRIAGKTGTAQIPVAGHYDAKKTIASFVGFAPADNPKFVMLVMLVEPQSSQWGSETAAPLFFSVAKDILLYLGIPPS